MEKSEKNKLITLFFCSVLGAMTFLIEVCTRNLWMHYGLLYACYSFFLIPVVFGLWLYFFCRVRASWGRYMIFAFSYAVSFVLAWILWAVLLGDAWWMADFLGDIGSFILGLLTLPEKFFSMVFTVLYVLYFVVLYLLFIIENLAVKKIFCLSFDKTAWLILFLYPAVIAVFSVLAQFPFVVCELNLESLLDIHFYFYTGSVIFGYMMCEGLIFIRGSKNQK